jgi:hypothetical protein
MAPSLHDSETQAADVKLEQGPTKPASPSAQDPPEPADLASAPLIKKSHLGSSLWAQDQCERRIGLYANEAVRFLSIYTTLQRIRDNPLNAQELAKLDSQAVTLRSDITELEGMKCDASKALREVLQNSTRLARIYVGALAYVNRVLSSGC